MDSRIPSASGKIHNRGQSEDSSNQPADNSITNELIQEFICPVTAEVMFEPVMISGCSHLIERHVAIRLHECPHRCDKGQDHRIKIVSAPPTVTNMLAKILETNPALWQQVYLNHDDLAGVLRNDQLKTSTGERFIKLLENNSEKNLNDQVPDGVQCGKSVIQILANYYAGRELLRRNKKICSLISDKTKAIEIDGKTIEMWISTNEVKPEVTSSRVSQPVHHIATVDNIWLRVVYGNEDGVLEMIQNDPRLFEQKATVTDYSGRVVDNATPFQMALRAGDEVMAKKIKAIYHAANPEDAQAELDAQCNEIYPYGYAAHLEEQKRRANLFECDIVNPLIVAFNNASTVDLQTALEKRNNGSELHLKLQAFKDAFHRLSMEEKSYNPNHLLKVFEEYNRKIDAWNSNDDNPNYWLWLDLFWRQVIGWEERYMATNFLQSLCTGLRNLVKNGQRLQRTLTLRVHVHDTTRDILLFPLGSEPDAQLGVDFAVCGSGFPPHRQRPQPQTLAAATYFFAGGGAISPTCNLPRASISLLRDLFLRKSTELRNVVRPVSSRRISSRCLMQ